MTEGQAIDAFIARWRANEGGAERANFPLFLTELAALLGLPSPDPAGATHANNDYVFERAVSFKDEAGQRGHGRIDLYKRGCFVLEAKQSRERGGAKEVPFAASQQTLPGLDANGARGRRSAHRGWDVLMRNAREQAEQYARALPVEHGWPPFILVCDVGHAIEVFADFSGQGKNYRQFPDRAGFRIYLDDLREPQVQDRLRAIWTDPHALDPARRAAAVTRDIAKRLASVSKLLEQRGYQPQPVAHFLMRCLFTMFAEDTGLLEHGSFTEVLADARADPASFAPMLEDLWRTMDTGGFSPLMRRQIRKFNGGLFAERTAIPLQVQEIGELYEAARHDWTEVEPAIFGTLLEQALDSTERRQLGAHYTPRTYVERLVNATVIEPLQTEWTGAVLGTVERERTTDVPAAIRAVHDFHEKLVSTRVLDPACGTGNFLYVALELMKRLEGDVLEVLAELGGQEALALETTSVHPRNFLGLELNPRAAAIAELVLWLGHLQWQMRNGTGIADPVLEKLGNIVVMDAVLRHDGERPNADRSGTELANPRRPEWPEADYIVGNPPFIGGKDVRSRLGDAYATALWKANPGVNKSADFVMYWWDRAAAQLARKGSRLKRFGAGDDQFDHAGIQPAGDRQTHGCAPAAVPAAGDPRSSLDQGEQRHRRGAHRDDRGRTGQPRGRDAGGDARKRARHRHPRDRVPHGARHGQCRPDGGGGRNGCKRTSSKCGFVLQRNETARCWLHNFRSRSSPVGTGPPARSRKTPSAIPERARPHEPPQKDVCN